MSEKNVGWGENVGWGRNRQTRKYKEENSEKYFSASHHGVYFVNDIIVRFDITTHA